MREIIKLLKPLFRGSLFIILVMFLSVMVARKYLTYVVPMYDSRTKLKLADINEGVQNSNLFKNFDVFATTNKIAAEIELIKSSLLINKTLDSLDFDIEIYRIGKLKSIELYNNSPFNIEYERQNDIEDKRFGIEVRSNEEFLIYEPNSKELITSGMFGKELLIENSPITISLDTLYINKKPNINLIDNYEFEILSRQKLIAKISSNLDVRSVDKDVSVLSINYKNATPVKASKFVNNLAETYIQDYIETKYKAAETTASFLDEQIKDITKKLSNSESRIEKYRNANKITNIRQETETNLRKLSQLKIQQTNVKMNLEAIQSLNKYVQNKETNFLELAPNFEAFTDLLSTELIKNIKALQAEKKDLLLVFTPKDERVIVIDEKLNDLTTYLIESINNTKNNLEIKYNNLCEDIKEFEKEFITVPEKEKYLTLMNREFEIYQKTYISLNEKRIEAEIAKAAKISFHRIISPAQPSLKPSSPNRIIILIVSAILGMLGSIIVIYLLHLSKINDKQTLESKSGIAIAGTTPQLYNYEETKKHFLHKANELDMKGLASNKEIICFTSFKNKEGSLFNAIQLAHAFSKQDRKVLLLDHSEQLNTEKYEYILKSCNHENLNIVELPHDKYINYTQNKMAQKLQELRADHDIIVILNADVNTGSSLLLMSIATVNLFVLDSKRTPTNKVIEVDLLKEEYKFKNLQFLLNKTGSNTNSIKSYQQYIKRLIRSKKQTP